MIDGILTLSFFVLVVAMLLGFYRLARGPTVVDRVLAFDAVVLCAVSMTVLLSRLWETPLYLELILIVSSLGFFGTVALVFYLDRTMPDDGNDAGVETEPEPKEKS